MRLERVVLAIGQLGLGGTERQVVLLATGLRERNIDADVAVLFGGGPREEELKAAGVPVWFGNVPHGQARALVPLALPRLHKWLRAIAPQVVHVFTYPACVIVGPVARTARVPVVVAGRRSLGDFKDGRPLVTVAERLTNWTYDVFVANAQAVATDVVRREGTAPGRVKVIPNALDPAAFDEVTPASLPGAPPHLLCVANLIAYKGHRYLIQAHAQLFAAGVTSTLVLVGDGDARKDLEKQAGALGAPVVFLGTRRDVPNVLAAADVVVLPSLHEGMSNVLMEAMAAGCAIVATDVGGNGEVLAHTGILCAPGSAAALAAAIGALLHEPATRAALGRAARWRAETAFGLEPMIDRHVELYERLLENRCAG